MASGAGFSGFSRFTVPGGTSVFKALTGGDPLTAEYKVKDAFEFIPCARLIFSANHPPG